MSLCVTFIVLNLLCANKDQRQLFNKCINSQGFIDIPIPENQIGLQPYTHQTDIQAIMLYTDEKQGKTFDISSENKEEYTTYVRLARK